MGRKFNIFALFYFVFEGKFQEQAPRGAYTQRGDLTEGFLRYDFGGLYSGGDYTWRGNDGEVLSGKQLKGELYMGLCSGSGFLYAIEGGQVIA